MSGLTVKQLQLLANQPAETWARLEEVLCALAGAEEEAQWACEALENCGPPPSDSLRVAGPLIGHPNELVASWACKLVARASVEAHWAEPFLIEALSAHRPKLVREEAARALGSVGPTSVAAREALTVAALEGGPRLKRLATASLGG